MKTTSTLALAATLLAIATTTQGCAVLLTGYLIGDAVQRNRAIETCRANLKITNDARIAKGQEPFPDQCAGG